LMDILAITVLCFAGVVGLREYRGLLGAALGGAVAIILALAYLPLTQLLNRIPFGSRPGSLWAGARLRITALLTSARVLLRPQVLYFGFVLALAAWTAEAVGLQLISRITVGPALPMADAIGIYAVATLVGGLSFLPGGLGSTEAVMIALLSAEGFSVSDAIVITLICRVITLWFAVAIGWTSVLMLRPRRARREIAT